MVEHPPTEPCCYPHQRAEVSTDFNKSRLTFIIMHYINSHSCLVPIREIKALLTAILLWLIRIYPWTALEAFCKQAKTNSIVLIILIVVSKHY